MRDDWKQFSLGEIVELGKGGSWGEDDPSVGLIQAVCLRGTDIADLIDGKIPDAPVRWIKESELRKSECSKDMVLIETSGSKCGRSIVLTEEILAKFDLPVIYSNFCRTLRIETNTVTREFIQIWFSHNYANGLIPSYRATSAMPNLDVKALLRVEHIQVPPLPEQKRIVDLISSLDSYIEALQQQQNFAKQLLQALCQKTFLAEGDFVKLHTVATCIMGQSPEGSTCNKDGIGTPLLTGPTEFQRNNWVGPPRQWTTNETKISISQDILFCVRGATAGRMNLTNYRSVIGRGLAAIRCEDPMDTHFVRFALQFGLNQLLPSAGGTIFPNISQSQLRGFNLPWPNETERRSLASLLKSVEDNTETLDQNLAATKNLRSSLLHDLLSGKHEIPSTYDKAMGAA